MNAWDAEQAEIQRTRRDANVGAHLATHAQALKAHKAEIIKAKQATAAARAETARLAAALDAERARVADLEKRHYGMLVESDVTERQIAADVEKLADHVTALDQSMAVSIRKSAAPRETRKISTPVRDPKTRRITEVIVIDEARPGVAVIQVPIRDASMQIIRTESYEVPVEDEDESAEAEDRSQPTLVSADDVEAIRLQERGL